MAAIIGPGGPFTEAIIGPGDHLRQPKMVLPGPVIAGGPFTAAIIGPGGPV